MNTSDISSSNSVNLFLSACSSSCQKLVNKIQSIKRSLRTEFRQRFNAHDHMLQLALNEAEALAHETDFPLLVFPTLAREKVEAVAAWRTRQEALWESSLERLAA
jgi:hypothetical protein